MEQLRRNCMTWLERTNPLRGLSISRAGTIYDNARVWGSPWLQYVFNEIEQTDPVLMTCVERRASALAGLERKFVARASSDKVLADEQRDALDKFAAGIENFTETLEHLDGAFFQGFAHVQPIWDGQKVQHCQVLKSWNFLRDGEGRWLWNPNCRETPNGLETVEGAWLVSLARKRFIDWPCLNIYIRKALGHRDYGRFIERHGVPHAVIIMPPGTDDSDKPKYIAAASRWQNGQDIALPAESSVNLAAEARGADPFTPFIELQDKYTVLLSTGGTLTSLAQADTGSLAGGAQMEVWREIVARDGVAIADALNRCLFRRYLELAFPGQPVAAEFQLSNEKQKTPEEVADLAGKLKAAGYSIAQEELQEAVGFTLVKDEKPLGDFGIGGLGDLSRPITHNKAPTHPTTQSPNHEILAAFAKDMSPAGKAVAELLKDLENGEAVSSPLVKEKASALLERLPSLIPDDPETAAVIAEAMAKEFSVGRDVHVAPHANKGGTRSVASAADKEELTQADAEKLYEEIMSK